MIAASFADSAPHSNRPDVPREPMSEHRAPPPSFICPLTLELMVDPVTAADGHSYESAAIKQWLQSSALSPLTGKVSRVTALPPAAALRGRV